MSSLMSTLGIDRLSQADQIQLAEEILDNLGAGREPPPLTEAQRSELDRRVVALDANQMGVSPWKEVEARVLSRLQQ